jgi:hypothetical protein
MGPLFPNDHQRSVDRNARKPSGKLRPSIKLIEVNERL